MGTPAIYFGPPSLRSGGRRTKSLGTDLLDKDALLNGGIDNVTVIVIEAGH